MVMMVVVVVLVGMPTAVASAAGQLVIVVLKELLLTWRELIHRFLFQCRRTAVQHHARLYEESKPVAATHTGPRLHGAYVLTMLHRRHCGGRGRRGEG